MADSTQDNPHTHGPGASGRPGPTGRGGDTGRGSSLGFVVSARHPGDAVLFCGAAERAVPAGERVEFLILDDHTNPLRREVISAVDDHGDSVRLVTRPAGGPAAELDAASLASCSEFLVVTTGATAPWNSLLPALGALRSDGSDFVAVAPDPALPKDPDPYARIGLHLGLREAAGPSPGTPGTGPGRLVVMRRWAARWLFADVASDPDPVGEVSERAGLLGLRVLELDAAGVVTGGT